MASDNNDINEETLDRKKATHGATMGMYISASSMDPSQHHCAC